MIDGLSSTVTLFKTAATILKNLRLVENRITIDDVKVELNSIILTLQNNQSSLQQEYDKIVSSKNNIEHELSELKDYNSKKSKYTLKNIAIGTFAYVPKEEIDRINDQYWLCQNCLDNYQRFSVYQMQQRTFDTIPYGCPNCPSKIIITSPTHGTTYTRKRK